MSSRLARARKEKGEKKKEEDGSRCREEARRDEYVDFMAKGLKRAFDLDRRRSASPRERQDPPRERSPRRPRQEESRRSLISPPPPHPHHHQQAPGRGTSRAAASHGPRGQEFRGPQYQQWPGGQFSRASGRHDSRAAELTQRGLPLNTPSGPSRRRRRGCRDGTPSPISHILTSATTGFVIPGQVTVKKKKKIDTITDRPLS
ncbi:hypothetical protein N7536_002531 [Penicillium majusculum]|nr:hypothetical protein N7536_002531 [Penicillium majusculum]